MSNLEHNEKILKVFSNIRCLNRDQLPRYLDGRQTDVEKHLVEQHLVDCDLCFDALQVLQQPQYREKYQPLATGMLQYIRNSIKQVSHAHKAERYQRQEQQKESFLIYFWAVAAIVAIAGGIYLVQQQGKFRATAMNRQPVQTENENTQRPVQAAVITPVPETKRDTVSATRASSPAPATAPAPATTTPTLLAAAETPKPVAPPKKDSAKAAPKPPPTKDSVKQPAAKPVEKPATKEPAPEPKVPHAEETKPAPKAEVAAKKEKEKDDDDDKPAPKSKAEASGTDEFLYKAAMVYHQQGDLNEAISRYKHLSASSGRYGELSRYQLAVCYRSKGQTGKARRMFKEVVKMNGSMKDKAQQALDNL
jgi:tetratricopeptide (TPR) repeat protein